MSCSISARIPVKKYDPIVGGKNKKILHVSPSCSYQMSYYVSTVQIAFNYLNPSKD